MLKVILIDDEPKALASLQWELERACEDVAIIGVFEQGTAARDFLSANEVDCIFLDIEMPDLNGFKLLEYFPNRTFSVIITTAFNQYAVKAIKQMALDYLLKPIDESELKDSLEKVRRIQNERFVKQTTSTQLASPLFGFDYEKKVGIPYDGRIVFINPSEILYCEGDGNYCYLILESGNKMFLTQNLKFIEAKVAAFNFFRIHNSYLINLNKIKEYLRNQEKVVLIDGTELPVSRLRKTQFLNQF